MINSIPQNFQSSTSMAKTNSGKNMSPSFGANLTIAPQFKKAFGNYINRIANGTEPVVSNYWTDAAKFNVDKFCDDLTIAFKKATADSNGGVRLSKGETEIDSVLTASKHLSPTGMRTTRYFNPLSLLRNADMMSKNKINEKAILNALNLSA